MPQRQCRSLFSILHLDLTSTTQVQRYDLLEPCRARGTFYSALSLGAALLTGIVAYGSAVWTL